VEIGKTDIYGQGRASGCGSCGTNASYIVIDLAQPDHRSAGLRGRAFLRDIVASTSSKERSARLPVRAFPRPRKTAAALRTLAAGQTDRPRFVVSMHGQGDAGRSP